MPFQKNHVPWNKGNTNSKCLRCKRVFHISLSRLLDTKIKRGLYCSRSCCDKAKIGREPGNKGKKGLQGVNATSFKKGQYAGKLNNNWKEEGYSYTALHNWVKRRLIKPKGCQKCGSNYRIQLANKSGKYLRDLTDWIWLCVICHRRYDGLIGDWRTRPNRIKERFYGISK